MTGLKLSFIAATFSAAGLVGVATGPGDVIDTGIRLAELPAVAFLGVALTVSLLTGYYLIRFMLNKFLSAMASMESTLQRVADMMENCRMKNNFPKGGEN